ncbi:hypothetical protein THRCLA_00792, partial [Thraustotheca clavata]
TPSLPLNRHVMYASTWDDAKNRVWDIVDLHPLNQQVDVFLPGMTPGSVGQLAREGSFFYSIHITPLALVQECLSHPELRYYALLKNTPEDGANSLALFPSGQLILSLDHATYIQFGIIGEKVEMPCKSGQGVHGRKYRVVIDLLAKNMQEGTEYRGRVLTCLKRFPAVDLLICAVNARGNIQTISVDGFKEEDDEGIPLRKRLEVNSKLTNFPALAMPESLEKLTQTPSSSTEWHEQQSKVQELYEWLGLVACGIVQPIEDEYVSTYVPPYNESSPHQAVNVRWRGLITEALARYAVEYAKNQVQDGLAPFAAVTVWGFPDTLASWWQKGKRRDHGYKLEGSNSYTIICLPGNAYKIIQSLGSSDTAA